MISIPEDLLGALDEAAARASSSRSAFIRDAVRERLARADPDRRRAALTELRRSMRAGSWRAEDLVRAERDR